MPTKKATKTKKTKKAPAKAPEPAKETVKAKKCECENCKCACAGTGIMHSQLSFYVLIALLVATLTVLVISLSFNRSVRDIFRPETYVYNGMFSSESTGEKKDENNIPLLSSGAVIDMLASGSTGFLIVSDENSLDSDAFARRVATYSDGTVSVYRYNVPVDKNNDDSRAINMIGSDEAPAFIYIEDGAIYDRLDAPKEEEDLKTFLQKYSTPSED